MIKEGAHLTPMLRCQRGHPALSFRPHYTHTHPLPRALGAGVFVPGLHQNTEFPSPVSLLPGLASPCFTPTAPGEIQFCFEVAGETVVLGSLAPRAGLGGVCWG